MRVYSGSVAMMRNRMPIYEYKCEKCGRVVEKILKSEDKDAAHIICNYCPGAPRLKRIVSTPGKAKVPPWH